MSHKFGKVFLTVFTSAAALLLTSQFAFAAEAIPVGGESYIKVIFAVGAMIGAGLAIGLGAIGAGAGIGNAANGACHAVGVLPTAWQAPFAALPIPAPAPISPSPMARPAPIIAPTAKMTIM